MGREPARRSEVEAGWVQSTQSRARSFLARASNVVDSLKIDDADSIQRIYFLVQTPKRLETCQVFPKVRFKALTSTRECLGAHPQLRIHFTHIGSQNSSFCLSMSTMSQLYQKKKNRRSMITLLRAGGSAPLPPPSFSQVLLLPFVGIRLCYFFPKLPSLL